MVFLISEASDAAARGLSAAMRERIFLISAKAVPVYRTFIHPGSRQGAYPFPLAWQHGPRE